MAKAKLRGEGGEENRTCNGGLNVQWGIERAMGDCNKRDLERVREERREKEQDIEGTRDADRERSERKGRTMEMDN